MKAKATALLLADLGITRSHSRPHTSNDNPFSESHFKTLKYQPLFPQRFGCIEDAKIFCRSFFDWYNQAHHHAGIGLMTPDQVHYGQADAVYDARQQTLERVFLANPNRFVNSKPKPPQKPIAAWINPPPKPTKHAAASAEGSKMQPTSVGPCRSINRLAASGAAARLTQLSASDRSRLPQPASGILRSVKTRSTSTQRGLATPRSACGRSKTTTALTTPQSVILLCKTTRRARSMTRSGMMRLGTILPGHRTSAAVLTHCLPTPQVVTTSPSDGAVCTGIRLPRAL
jgi:hypothetical protein